MRLGTFYIITKDIEGSVDFYGKLLQEAPIYRNENRWVQFSNFIALYNPSYDKSIIPDAANENFNQAYIDDVNTERGQSVEKTVPIPADLIPADGTAKLVFSGVDGKSSPQVMKIRVMKAK